MRGACGGRIAAWAREAIGGTIAFNYGFINAFWAILAVGLISRVQMITSRSGSRAGFGQVFSSPTVVVLVTAFLVVISQVKINMTNAYASSLAWSNFFERLTHSHPARVVLQLISSSLNVVECCIRLSSAGNRANTSNCVVAGR